jgi:hypothetical protein
MTFQISAILVATWLLMGALVYMTESSELERFTKNTVIVLWVVTWVFLTNVFLNACQKRKEHRSVKLPNK